MSSIVVATSGPETGTAGSAAAAFVKNDIMPNVVEVAVAFAGADLPEVAAFVQLPAGMVTGESLPLKGPVTGGFRCADQSLQQCLTNPVALG